jgi:hypothetical protein
MARLGMQGDGHAAEVTTHYGLAQPLGQAGYYETDHHKRLLQDIRGSVLEGRLILVHRIIGYGKTVTLRRLQRLLKEEEMRAHRFGIATSLALVFSRHWEGVIRGLTVSAMAACRLACRADCVRRTSWGTRRTST